MMNWLDRVIMFFLKNKLIVTLFVIGMLFWGIMTAPFDWNLGGLERSPVPVDAIPDIGENQQIVFTKWMGRSPQDVEDQVSYPLTVSLLGVPGVKTVRSYSMFGFSSIYVIFKEDVDFYWSRSRILERLNSLPADTLPDGVQPMLGPDATALGQVFWYTLEGRDEKGNPTGGWDLHELRTIQDWYVRYALLAADGISEVASVGGFVREYQVDVDPDAMRAHNVTLEEVFNAVKMSNLDVGARTIEINKVEYVIRGLGFVKHISDIENSVIKVNENVPIYVKTISKVSLGPALRRGALDKEGAEVVGGVAVVRYGGNPLEAIKNLKKKITEISQGLPKKTLADGRVSQVNIVPFYDRTGLIQETLGTLNIALTEEILVTIIVVMLMLMNLRSSVLISGLLPLAVLMSFIAMKYFHVDANIVALSGIAIAIGTMVDMGIVLVENIIKHLDRASPEENRLQVVFRGASEVGSAVLTAVSTTIVGFLPVFTMVAAEGKLFRPLAFTKTFALIASIIVALVVIPAFAHWLLAAKKPTKTLKDFFSIAAVLIGFVLILLLSWWIGLIVILVGGYHLFEHRVPLKTRKWVKQGMNYLVVFVIGIILTKHWLPLGPGKGLVLNFLFVGALIGGVLVFFKFFERSYARVLKWILTHRGIFFSLVGVIVLLGSLSWLGFNTLFGWLPNPVRAFGPVAYIAHKFPGLGREFMPPLDEGSFLYMPTTMPHASIGEVLDVLQKQDMGFAGIPEIDTAVGKLGRAETPLDPAPISMIETVINYKSQYKVDEKGRHLRFRFAPGEVDFFRDESGTPLPGPDGEPYKVKGKYLRDEQGNLIPDSGGYPFRLWRPALDPDLNPGRRAWPGINSPNDIWDEILKAGKIPGTTSAPFLQPISARIVMLQSGMRAPMGIKIKGPDLQTIENVGLQIEKLLKNEEVSSIEPSAVIADRIVGKPYLEIEIDREAIARYGIHIQKVQDVIEVAVGGKKITTTVEGRERYPVRVRYLRELRNSFEALDKILVPAPGGAQIPLGQLAKINYVRGPQMIKSEDTFLVGYVLFDKKPGYAEVDVVEAAQRYLAEKIKAGDLQIPAGVSYVFAGSYENQLRASKTLMIILPLALFIIFLILYFQFKRVSTTLLVFSGIIVAWAGGFILIWLYGQSWFLDFSVFGVNMQNLFQAHPINLSVAVWVGFLALFGIASDDGVIIATYLDQVFEKHSPSSVEEIREATIEAGKRRIRPALMTIATTILALLPVLTSTGRGADIMVPMAIPTFGGMFFALITLFVVPVSYCWIKEMKVEK
jgi:Cu(I)/Ag(I) efflux system membrane protein CusA/SilA